MTIADAFPLACRTGTLMRAQATMALFALALMAYGAGVPARANPASVESTVAEKTCSGIGTVWWNELLTPDPELASQFYARVMGWAPKTVALADQAREPRADEARYTLFLAKGREAAGLMKQDDPNSIHDRPGWFIYVQVKDVDAAVSAALANGGKLLNGPIALPGTGRMAVIQDPFGATFGLITPTESASC